MHRFLRNTVFIKTTKDNNTAQLSPLLLLEAFAEEFIRSPILIMPWSVSQQTRLSFEKDLLERYFGNRVSWIDPRGNTRVEITVTCTNDKQYTLRIYLPGDFPNSCPSMVVSNPSSCLRKRDGSVMNSGSSDNHTWDSKDGCTQICHYKPAEWTDDNTLYQVTMKGLIWLEAYEAHLRTGNSLSNYLQHY